MVLGLWQPTLNHVKQGSHRKHPATCFGDPLLLKHRMQLNIRRKTLLVLFSGQAYLNCASNCLKPVARMHHQKAPSEYHLPLYRLVQVPKPYLWD